MSTEKTVATVRIDVPTTYLSKIVEIDRTLQIKLGADWFYVNKDYTRKWGESTRHYIDVKFVSDTDDNIELCQETLDAIELFITATEEEGLKAVCVCTVPLTAHNRPWVKPVDYMSKPVVDLDESED
jgi:hypothetical protein